MDLKFVTTVFIGLMLTIQGVSQNPINHGGGSNSFSKNEKKSSVDKNEIDFNVSKNKVVSDMRLTPSPKKSIDDNHRDLTCPFNVPCDDPANRDASNTTTVKYFQIQWHVFTDGGPSTNIDQTQVNALMAELNSDFAPHNMVFCANPTQFIEDVANYTHDPATEEFSLKSSYAVNPSKLINVYVVGTMTLDGYARFPYESNGGTNINGGIVLNRNFTSVGMHTLTHNMGHLFGLEHTFVGVSEMVNCSSCYEKVRNVNGSSNTTGVPTPLGGPYTGEGDREGDWCSDTNPHDPYPSNCSTSSNPNGACDSYPWANAPVSNFMSHSSCPTEFTPQQGRRMHCMIDSYLSCWTSYGNSVCGSGPPLITPSAGNDQNLCGTYTTTLAGNDPGPETGLWTLESGSGTITSPTSFNSSVTGLGVGNNIFVWTIGTTCPCSDTVIITVNNNSTGTDTQTACDSLVWIDGNTYYSNNNTATFNIVGGAANACDSLVTLNLTINNSATGTDSQTACNSFTWIDGNTYNASNQTATFNIINGAASGCDSLVALDLTILNSATGTDAITVCDSLQWIDGNTYYADNDTATFNFIGGAANGCDSLVILDLTVNHISDLTTTLNGTTISSNAIGASYQWLNCDNGYAVIVGETNQSYVATSNGNYAVELTENGCIDTSACVSITTVGIIENQFGDQLIIYPNPTDGNFAIDLGEVYNVITVEITDLGGKLVKSRLYRQRQLIELSIKESSGTYLIRLKSGNKEAIIRLVKN